MMDLLRAVVAGVTLATVVGYIVKDSLLGASSGELTQFFVDDVGLIQGNLEHHPCRAVKRIFWMLYEETKGQKEPDLNQLTIEFASRIYRDTHNINAAAELIPKSPGYDANQEIFIFLHGFTVDPTHVSFHIISEALLKHGEFNVLSLNASPLTRWLYLRSNTYVRFIGEKLGSTLATLVENGVDPKRIHLIGHSLGSHVAGFTGKKFTELTGERLGRITGLDPSGPCFSPVEEALRLNTTDADYVDVVHTDIRVYGSNSTYGHVDYFVNGGHRQPDCLLQTCNHNRVWALYAQSVKNPKIFPAIKCNGWLEFKLRRCDNRDVSDMGFASKPGTTGHYYLQTSGITPYGRGKDGLKYKWGGWIEPGDLDVEWESYNT